MRRYKPLTRRTTKRYTTRKRYVPRSMPNNQIIMKCEAYDTVQAAIGSGNPVFGSTTNSFLNVKTLFANSNTYTQNIREVFTTCKITGLAFDCTPITNANKWEDAFPSSGPSPNVAICFYPSLLSSDIGDYPKNTDSSLEFCPAQGDHRRKYIRFKDNYYLGDTSYGYGIRQNANGFANFMPGQFSVAYTLPVVATSSDYCMHVKFTFYVVCYKLYT